MKNRYAVQENSPGRRAAAYWFIDGLPEILFGFVFFIHGILVLATVDLQIRIPIQSLWIRWVIGTLTAWLGLFVWIFHRPILNSIKRRITYPRTGYVRPPVDLPFKARENPSLKILTPGTSHPTDDNFSSFTSEIILVIVAGFVFLQFLHTFYWGLPLVMSGIAAAIYLLSRDSVRPYSWYSVLPIALAGFIAAALDLEPMSGMYVPMLACGVWLLVVGIWTFVGYLRANPKLDSGQEGRQ